MVAGTRKAAGWSVRFKRYASMEFGTCQMILYISFEWSGKMLKNLQVTSLKVEVQKLTFGGLAGPHREIESALVGGAGVDRFAVGDDDALEGEVEKGAQSGQRTLLMRGRRPDA